MAACGDSTGLNFPLHKGQPRHDASERCWYLQDFLHGGHAELQGAVVHEAENVAKAGSRQPFHVDLILVSLPHVGREHDPEVVALGGQQRLVGLWEESTRRI